MRLGYLYSRYPVISQTFCDTEMLALEQLGVPLEIGSVYPPLTSLRHEHLSRLRAPIRYAPHRFEVLAIMMMVLVGFLSVLMVSTIRFTSFKSVGAGRR